MGKKVIVILLLSVIVSGSLFAQEEEVERAKNRISASAGLIVGELSYERVLNPYFSVLGQVSYINLIAADSISVAAKGRWYPFGGAFFIDLGLGYSNGYNIEMDVVQAAFDMTMLLITVGLWALTPEFQSRNKTNEELVLVYESGFLIQPSIGWNIDIGKKDKFMLPISLGLDIRLAKETTVLPFFKLGVGYSF